MRTAPNEVLCTDILPWYFPLNNADAFLYVVEWYRGFHTTSSVHLLREIVVHTPPQLRSCYRIWESTLGDSKQCENLFDLSSALLSRLPLTVYFYHMSSSFSYISCSFLGLKHFAPLIKLGFPLRRPNKFGSPLRAKHLLQAIPFVAKNWKGIPFSFTFFNSSSISVLVKPPFYKFQRYFAQSSYLTGCCSIQQCLTLRVTWCGSKQSDKVAVFTNTIGHVTSMTYR